MKLLKTQREYIYCNIRNNLILAKYCNEQKKEELLKKNIELRIQLNNLKNHK